MRRRALGIAVALVLALPVAAWAVGRTTTQPQARTYPPSVVTQGRVHGISFASAAVRPTAYIPDLPRLRADGINLINVYVYQYVSSPKATVIRPGPNTATDAELTAVTNAAHAQGIAVELFPVVFTSGTYTWRGIYYPSDDNAWFASYRTMLNHYASLAQSLHVELLAIGSEYSTLEGHAADWRRVAREARARYSGPLTYMSTVDDPTLSRVTWWDAVDYIGFSPYFSLSTADKPSYQELYRAWQYYLPRLRSVTARYHRPVLFDEIGYVSAQRAAFHSWDWNPGTPPDEQVQADAYRALLDATAHEKWLSGIVWFQWSQPTAAPVDVSFSPRDKLAECVLAAHWGSAAVSSAVGPPLAGLPGACIALHANR